MRPKFQKQSALKLAGRIIPQSGGNETPKLTLGFHSRDSDNTNREDVYLNEKITGRGSTPAYRLMGRPFMSQFIEGVQSRTKKQISE